MLQDFENPGKPEMLITEKEQYFSRKVDEGM